MIDFIKLKITDDELINRVWNNPLLDYDGKSEKLFMDEIKEKYSKKYKNLYFIKHQNRLEICGSLHYFFNDGLHNANDFYISNCMAIIKQLQELLKLDLSKCYLINLEYGFNIVPDILIENLIMNLIYHEKRQFVRGTKYVFYKIAGKDAYKQIKAYAKGVQFPSHCNPNTFRFEVKTKQAKFINNLGLYTLQDLMSLDNYELLIDSLLKEWNSVLVFDLSKKIDDKFFNMHFWEQIILVGSRNKFNNQKRNYFSQLGIDNLHNNIKVLLIEKGKQLINCAISN